MGKISKALGKTGSDKKSSPRQTKKAADAGSVISKIQPKALFSPHSAKVLPSELTEKTTRLWDERLKTAVDKFSMVAENIRKLRSKILYPESGKQIRSIMISSSEAQEGKSFICANLGISLAQSMERHALMVDCDLRRPTLQGLFGLGHEKGLTDYLRDRVRLSQLIQQTGLDKLSIIPSGNPPHNPSELLSSDKMADMIEELTERYDDRLVLFDSPPFHAASETLVLSQQVDKVIIVVRWGKSGRETVKKMVDSIGPEKILGVVFNSVELNILDKNVQGLSSHNYYSESYY